MAKEKESPNQTPGAPDVPRKLKKTIKEDKSHEEHLAEKAETEVKEEKGSSATSVKSDKVEQVIESKKTDDAVADIVRKEGDELLDNYDQDSPVALPKPKKSWWKRKWFIWTVILLILATVATLMAIPQTRYAILNKIGVRVGASLTVVDKTTGQPLKNVIVELADNSAKTDQDGSVTFGGLKQGPQDLKISRVAFGKIEKSVTLGWGSNPLGTFELNPSGAQYTFIVRDILANQPIEGAEVTSGQAVAKSDKDGKAVLTLGQTAESEVSVTISAGNFRNEETTLAINTSQEVNVNLVPAQKAVFVSSADGKYNLYSMFIDGKDRKIILEGTGNEASDMALAVSTDGSKAALVSTREDIKNEDGSLLETLSLVDVAGQNSQSLERAAEVQIIDWIGNVLIYQLTAPGANQTSNSRQKLISYDVSSDKRVELATANSFTSVASAQGAVYYATGSDQYTTINPDGSGKSTIVNANIEHAYRTAYDTLMLQSANGWYNLSLSAGTATQAGAPGSTQNQIYVTDQDGQRSLWINGTTLNIHNIPGGTDSDLHSQGSLSYPVRWLNSDSILFRDGGADYAISAKGGDVRKVADVVSTTGVVQTY